MENNNIENAPNKEVEVKKDYSNLINTILIIIAFVSGCVFIYRITPNEIDKKFSEIDKINKNIEQNIVSCNSLIEESKSLASQRDEIVKQVSDSLKSRATTGMSIVTAKANIPASTSESNQPNSTN